jgi:hypothetical protein
MTTLCFTTFPVAPSLFAGSPSPASETYTFKIHGDVTYRCYGGYDSVKAVDSRTKVPCDNKTKKKALFDERVVVVIKVEPNPEDSKDLAGDTGKTVQFEGRKFTGGFSLFKQVDSPSPAPYRLRLVACDDEPTSRQTAVYADAKQVKDFNKLTINYISIGQPEEIQYIFSVEPVK